MFGVVVKSLNTFRKKGFHFIENEEGDFMIIERNNRILRMISLNRIGNIELRNSRGKLIKESKSIEIVNNQFYKEDMIWIVCFDDE